MMKSVHLYALFLVLIFCNSCGQNQTDLSKDNAEPKDIASSQGPNTMVRNVKKGSHGTILIAASFAGVFRYDPRRAAPRRAAGKPFTNLTSKIGSRRFWDVLEDRRGNLWFTSTDSGVYYDDGKSIRHFTTREGLASNSVMSVYEDKAGIIWFGTGGGLSRYDPGRATGKTFQSFTTKDRLPNKDVTTIMEDKTGKLWVGTRGDACFYNGKTFTVFRNKDGKAFNNVWAITEDKKGNIWFGATIIKDKKGDTLIVTAGLWRYDGSAFTNINQRGTTAIIEDKKGNIWTTGAVSPNGVGAWKLLRYDQKSLYAKKPVVTEIMSIEKMLCGILEAGDGSIWFGSISGVYRYNGKTITDFKSKQGQK
jgi:ligand-binding sensor domain-containing protein